jgi:hypothetical protein
MLQKSVAVAALVLFVPFTIPAEGQDSGVVYELHITCPVSGRITFSTNSLSTCPVRAVDPQDMMGDPSLGVDPLEPANLVIASLHGSASNQGTESGPVTFASGCGQKGPSPKSRCNQVFTTFTSDDYGAFWRDNPYFPPDEVQGAFGEHAQVTFDPYGHVFIGSLYAVPLGGGRFQYEVGAQKFEDIYTINTEQTRGGGCGGCYHLTWIEPTFPDNAIQQMWFLFNPTTDNMTMVWHEITQKEVANRTEPPKQCLVPEVPPLPCIPPPSGARSRHPGATVLDASAPTDASPMGVIGIVWSGASVEDEYVRQPFDQTIGPCSGGTNPVLSEGYVYVGCVANPSEGTFRWNPQTLQGTLELFRVDPRGQVEYMGASPLNGGAPKLGVRSDGRLALVTTQARDGQLELAAVFGHYKPQTGRIEWGTAESYGPKVTPPLPGVQVARPNIQDLIYREHSGVLHLILRETLEPSGVGAASASTLVGPHIRKTLLAIDEQRGIVGRLPLDIGNPANRTDPVLLQAPERAYEDLSDDLVQLPEGNFTFVDKKGVQHVLGDRYQRLFFAVGDYGTVIFAEVVEITNLRGPAVPPPVLPLAPLAAPATSASSILVPAAGASLAALLAFTFVAARRKNPAAAMAKMKK